MAKDGLNEVGVVASRTPGGVADLDRAIHCHRVAQPAIGATLGPMRRLHVQGAPMSLTLARVEMCIRSQNGVPP
jgi:hypothetical protein